MLNKKTTLKYENVMKNNLTTPGLEFSNDFKICNINWH